MVVLVDAVDSFLGMLAADAALASGWPVLGFRQQPRPADPALAEARLRHLAARPGFRRSEPSDDSGRLGEVSRIVVVDPLEAASPGSPMDRLAGLFARLDHFETACPRTRCLVRLEGEAGTIRLEGGAGHVRLEGGAGDRADAIVTAAWCRAHGIRLVRLRLPQVVAGSFAPRGCLLTRLADARSSGRAWRREARMLRLLPAEAVIRAVAEALAERGAASSDAAATMDLGEEAWPLDAAALCRLIDSPSDDPPGRAVAAFLAWHAGATNPR